MTQEEIKNLIKEIDLIKDKLIDMRIYLENNPNEEIGQAIYELKKAIDILLELYSKAKDLSSHTPI